MEWNFFVASSDAMLAVAWVCFAGGTGYILRSGYTRMGLSRFVGTRGRPACAQGTSGVQVEGGFVMIAFYK